MSEKERLIEELKCQWNFQIFNEHAYGAIADFILADRRRICQPLVNAYLHPSFLRMTMNGQLNKLHTATVETLKCAGIEQG